MAENINISIFIFGSNGLFYVWYFCGRIVVPKIWPDGLLAHCKQPKHSTSSAWVRNLAAGTWLSPKMELIFLRLSVGIPPVLSEERILYTGCVRPTIASKRQTSLDRFLIVHINMLQIVILVSRPWACWKECSSMTTFIRC